MPLLCFVRCTIASDLGLGCSHKGHNFGLGLESHLKALALALKPIGICAVA